MPYNREHFVERQRRLDAVFAQLTPCMNDTKWREVFLQAARHRASFQAAFVNDPGFNPDSNHYVLERWIGETGLRDPGIGGPCSYREILWIRFPRRIPASSPYVKNLDPLLADLERLGQLPLTKTDAYVEIRGYQQTSPPDDQ